MSTICENCKPRVEELEKEIKILKKSHEEFEKLLKLYESPHIPSSKRIIKTKKEEKPEKKRGAPVGHRGTTRKTPAPDMTISLEPKRCTGCNSRRIKSKEQKKLIEDIEIKKVTREFNFYECVCEDCGKEFTTSDENLPRSGKFGPNISALWSMLHYFGTVPFDRLSQISRFMGFDITPSGVHNVIYRTARTFKPYYNGIRRRVKNSKYARSDETSYPFNREKYWLWNLSTPKDTLVLIRNSRGSKVLKEVFGEMFDGILNTDCFSAYDKFKAREYQKCFAHINNSAKDLAKRSDEGKELYSVISEMYNCILDIKAKGNENTPKTKLWILGMKNKIHTLLGKFSSKAVNNLVLRMEKHNNSLFTCVKYAFVEPTNNASERDIRKNVVARKVSGLHRSELGIRSREIMMSTILTTQKRKLNPFEFVLKGIKNCNVGLGVG